MTDLELGRRARAVLRHVVNNGPLRHCGNGNANAAIPRDDTVDALRAKFDPLVPSRR
jgi:hypothetical protein